MFYQALISKDLKREVSRQRDLAEYAMAFMKPKVVEAVARRREQMERGDIDSNSADFFRKQVEEKFGKPLTR